MPELNLNFLSKIDERDDENLVYDIHELVVDFLKSHELEGLILTRESVRILKCQEEENNQEYSEEND